MYEYKARLSPDAKHPTGVIDGDTVHLDLDLGFYEWRIAQSYRLLRINAPELNTAAGKAAKTALEAFLRDKAVLIAQTQRSDNFGRFLTELIADGTNVSDWLVASGFAVYQTYT